MFFVSRSINYSVYFSVEQKKTKKVFSRNKRNKSTTMGNASSKKAGVTELKTPEKSSAAATTEGSPKSPSTATEGIDNAGKTLAVPPTPAIPQTPLTETIAHHLNRITTEDVNQYQKIQTPTYLLRKKILYDLGYTYSLKENDPRSPSQRIPRTPMNLENNNSAAEANNENDISSLQYNSTLEDSCREFNSKLDEITMDETEMAQHDVEQIEIDANCEETDASWCDQKTPDAENQREPDFAQHTNANLQNKTILVDDGTKSKKLAIPQESEENDEQNRSTTSTPVMHKSHRTGRIPLSVINRRVGGMPTENTPLQAKNTSGTLSIDKHRTNSSFGQHDENIRGSARKSKIPVFKK